MAPFGGSVTRKGGLGDLYVWHIGGNHNLRGSLVEELLESFE